MSRKQNVLWPWVAVVVLALASTAAAGLPGLVGYWKFDEGQGTTAFDSSGNGLHGTLRGNPTWTAGKVGGGLDFNGSTDYVEVPNNPLLALTTQITIAAWTNMRTTAGGEMGILSKGSWAANDLPYELTETRGGVIFWQFYNDGGRDSCNPNAPAAGEWHHIAATYDGKSFKCYIDGKLAKEWAYAGTMPKNSSPVTIGRRAGETGMNFNGKIDDVQLWSRALSDVEIPTIMAGLVVVSRAQNPSPADQATDVPRDATLSWALGQYPAVHDVYLGTTFTDANTAGRTDKKGVLASQGQADTTFDPPGALAYGQTYYWRIDEVNKSPDGTIYKGVAWSFTVEPYGYPVKPIKATASSFQANMGPENTINGSGLDKSGLHGSEPTTMWMSSGGAPNWIQYEFDKVYKFTDLKVWNSNQLVESFLGFGAKKVTIEYSTDGTTWTALAPVPEFARAPGAPGYAANTTVNLAGIQARFVKLTINSNWGGLAPQTGLAEVQFAAAPLQARAPQPADKSTGINVDTNLDWRPGREAGAHQVYFGTDPNLVAKATAPVKTVPDHGFTPDVLNYATTYYWRVDEVNKAAVVGGEVWSFSTRQFAVVDDFESYTDQAGAEVFSTWIDGFADNFKSSGSTVGLSTARNGTYGETTIIHGGGQSMPLAYDNSKLPLSEATRTFDKAQDWTASGIKSLSLWFRGVADNTGQLYLKINDAKVPYNGAAGDLAKAVWQRWIIDLSTVAGGVNKVTKLTIGVEGAGAKGTLYVDDIRLYPTTAAPITQPVITAVARAKGQSGTRTDGSPINGAYKADTAPVPMPRYGLVDDGFVYSDRNYPWSKTPAALVGSEYVLTYNTDKNTGTKDVTYTVTLSRAATVFLTCDDRITNQQAAVDLVVAKFAKPGQFKPAGLKLYVHENATTDRPMSVYAADLPAGTYVFGAQDSGNNFYTIGVMRK